MCGVAGVAHNGGHFAGEVGVINVLQEGEWGINDPSSCVHDALQGFPVLVGAAPTPHSDTVTGVSDPKLILFNTSFSSTISGEAQVTQSHFFNSFSAGKFCQVLASSDL